MNQLVLRACGLVVVASLLSGCINLTIDEETAFAPPQQRFDGPAQSVEQLNDRWAQRYAEAQGQGLVTLEPRGDFTLMTWEQGQRAHGSVPMQQRLVRHGLTETTSGSIAWSLFTVPEAAGAARPLIVHCAGNAGDRYNSASAYSNKALPYGDVLTFDYPGYADSAGTPSAASMEAASAAVVALAQDMAQGRDIVFWGHSLGGFVCARLAADTPGTDGLILETTARNADQVADAWTPWYARALVRIDVAPSLAGYDSAADAARFGGPVLVLGASEDDTLPVRLARTLAADLTALGAPVTYVEFDGAGHINVPSHPDFDEVLVPFFASIAQSQP